MELNISIEALWRGDEAELEHFYRVYYPHFLSFACNFVNDDIEVCRDIVQEVFIAYWQRHADFDDVVSLKVFFYRSLRNRCLNELRSRLNHGLAGIDEAKRMESLSALEENVVREEVALAVRTAIEQLSPQARRVLQMSLNGKSNKEIAAEMNVSVNTVKTHKEKSYAILRDQLRNIHQILVFLGI